MRFWLSHKNPITANREGIQVSALFWPAWTHAQSRGARNDRRVRNLPNRWPDLDDSHDIELEHILSVLFQFFFCSRTPAISSAYPSTACYANGSSSSTPSPEPISPVFPILIRILTIVMCVSFHIHLDKNTISTVGAVCQNV